MKKKTTQNIVDFSEDLKALCVKHGVFFNGTLRVQVGDKWDVGSFDIIEVEHINYGYAKDRCGPFFIFKIQEKPVISEFRPNRVVTQIMDKDKLLRDGVKSMADGQVYGNRREYNDHLKRNGMIEVGDQAPTKANTEIRGDYDVKSALREAIQKHL